MSEQKRVAIVTGATRGIGLAIATRLARDGYDIVANYRGDDEVAEAARLELETSGRTIVLTKGDISQADDAGALI
jgi:NAD(P)-dependent dehydrogenase (short-subunit alcohol dehydrogenase family)